MQHFDITSPVGVVVTAAGATAIHDGEACSRALVLQEGPQVDPGPLLLELPPVAWLQAQAFGNSLPSVVEWLPVPPHDLLLVIPCSLSFCLFHT